MNEKFLVFRLDEISVVTNIELGASGLYKDAEMILVEIFVRLFENNMDALDFINKSLSESKNTPYFGYGIKTIYTNK